VTVGCSRRTSSLRGDVVRQSTGTAYRHTQHTASLDGTVKRMLKTESQMQASLHFEHSTVNPWTGKLLPYGYKL